MFNSYQENISEKSSVHPSYYHSSGPSEVSQGFLTPGNVVPQEIVVLLQGLFLMDHFWTPNKAKHQEVTDQILDSPHQTPFDV